MYLFWCKNPKYQINNYFPMQENLENLIDISANLFYQEGIINVISQGIFEILCF